MRASFAVLGVLVLAACADPASGDAELSAATGGRGGVVRPPWFGAGPAEGGGGAAGSGWSGGAGGGVCDPEAAPLPNEGLVEPPGAGGCPPGMLPIDGFCIDRFEASLVYADGSGSFSPYHNPGDADVRAVSILGAVPQGYIDGDRAALACAASGKRLCTDAEWLRACRGEAENIYPYGNELEVGRCNDHRAAHPAIEYFGTSDAWIWSELGNACLDQLPDSLEPSGERPDCVSDDGVVDMMGNLHEWTADPAGTFRGGFYVDTVINGPGCLYATTAHNTLHWDYSTGFRCCADL